MPLAAEGASLRVPETAMYGTYIGRELADDDLYRESNRELRQRSRISEFLRTVEQRRLADLQLEELRELRRGWDSYDAEVPNTTAFRRAHEILTAAQQERLDVTRIVPSAEGGIGICFVASGRYAHIEASNDGELTLVMFSGNDPAEIREIHDEPALVQALHQIRQYTDL